jgi:transcriptional regulator with XRE-family HTH domain
MSRIERLKQRKKEIGITFDELAKNTGISRRAICALFSGKTENPRIDTVQAIEQALGLAPTITDEDRALGVSESNLIALSDNDRELIHLFAEAEEKLGGAYVRGVKQMVRIAIDTKGQS